MKKIKVYHYERCSTCRKALAFLDKKKIAYDAVSIVDQPPKRAELKEMLGHLGSIRKLFNTSGIQYREMKLSEKLPKMSEAEAIALLSSNGKLVKRPFVLGPGVGAVGFDEKLWKKLFEN